MAKAWFKVLFSQQYRPSGEILREYGAWEKPCEETAREKYVKEHTHHDVFDYKTTKTKDLKEFGEGHMLYFYFLKYTAIMFCILAVSPALVQIIVNLIGGFYERGNLERTTIGNYGLISSSGSVATLNMTGTVRRGSAAETNVARMFLADSTKDPAKLGTWNKRSTHIAMTVLDLVGCLIYFAFSIFMIWFIQKMADHADRNTVTVRDYSVRVEGVPHNTQDDELREYLERDAGEGSVIDIELCRKCNTLLTLVLERGKVVEEMDLANATLQRHAEVFPKVEQKLELEMLNCKYDLSLVNKAIEAEQSELDTNHVVAAFVIFRDEQAKVDCLAAHPRSKARQWLMPLGQRFRHLHPLHITEAPEPSDVKYENLEFGIWNRLMRRSGTNLLKYLALLIGFVLINLAPAIRVGLAGKGQGASKTSCDAGCDYQDSAGNYRLSDADRITYKDCHDTGVYPNKLDCETDAICYECFCRAVLNIGVYGESFYCGEYASILAIQTLSQVLAVVGILVVNLAIQACIEELTTVECHHTRSSQARSQTRALYQAQFVNTAFSSIIANAYLPGLAKSLKGSFLDGVVFTGLYSDVTPNWYRDVGRTIIISMILSTIIHNFKVLMMYLWKQYKLRNRYQCLTQHELNHAFTGHEFELSWRYGVHLNQIFVTMLFSAGMPLLYIVAAVHFVSAFWTEKYELLRLCKRPLTYSKDLAVFVSTTLPFAVLWHLAFALWMFSLLGVPESPLVADWFRSVIKKIMNGTSGLWTNITGLTPDLVAGRVLQNNAAQFLIFFLVCAVVLFLFFTLSTWIELLRSLASFSGIIKDTGRKATLNGVPEFPVAVRSQLLVGPESYRIQTNPAYAHAFLRLDDFDVDSALIQRVQAAMPKGGPRKAFGKLSKRERRRQRHGQMQIGKNQVVPETGDIEQAVNRKASVMSYFSDRPMSVVDPRKKREDSMQMMSFT